MARHPGLSLIQDFDPHTYLRLLVAQALVDGMTAEERDYILLRGALLDVDATELLERPLQTLPPVDPGLSETTRRVILRDCIVLACIDGDFSEAERERVHRLAEWLSVPVESVDRIEDWLHRYWDLMEEAEALLAGFEAPRTASP
ncbi:MAG: hypothetical protein VX899_00885 [Myxococcota bacterium]|nr:hypothetical protein [Myxococcota bacterium]